jgi:hypothetical protein
MDKGRWEVVSIGNWSEVGEFVVMIAGMPTMNSDACSVRDFLEKLWQIPRQPETAIELFRGQPNDWPLLPKLFRRPNTPESVQANEKDMLAFLINSTSHLRPSSPVNEWDWLSLGQHFGMSTRMSDWSANPLIALFFAVATNPTDGANPLVFHYSVRSGHVDKLKGGSPLKIRNTKVIKPHSHSIRSEAQAAWHVVHAIHEGRFLPLATMQGHKERIRRITIRPDKAQAIREELASWGIGHSTVYGDYESVCRSIASRFGLA